MRLALLLLLTGCTVYDFPPPAEPDPIALRSPLAVQGGPFVLVHSEEELLQAIARASGESVTVEGITFTFAAQRIVIAAPILLSAPVLIPSSLYGLTIAAASRGLVVRAKAAMDALFRVHGFKTTLEGIYGHGDSVVESFLRLDGEDATEGAQDLTVRGCDLLDFTYSIYRPTAAFGTLTSAMVEGNRMGGDVDIDTVTDSTFRGNNFDNHSIILRGGADNVITPNAMSGGNIDTSGTSGGNVCAPNTNIGGGSSFHGSDSIDGTNT